MRGRQHRDEAVTAVSGGVIVVRESAILRLTLDRPDRSNALTSAMVLTLTDEIERVNQDSGVRAVVIDAAGGRSFCGGFDLEELARGVSTGLFELMSALDRVCTPTVAVLSGHAVGAGYELASRCDIRLAAATAAVGFPAVRLGVAYRLDGLAAIIAASGGASGHLLTGEMVSVSSLPGFAHSVVQPGDLSSEVKRITGLLREAPPVSLRYTVAARRYLSRPTLSGSEVESLLQLSDSEGALPGEGSPNVRGTHLQQDSAGR